MGHDADRVSEFTAAYLAGFQGESLVLKVSPALPSTFPEAARRKTAKTPFPLRREQVYPGGMFDYHLKPFREAIAAGTAA